MPLFFGTVVIVVFIEPYTLSCSSDSYAWTGIVMAIKGLLLLFGAFIAVETRNIKMNLLNEAKEIALTIQCFIFNKPLEIDTKLPSLSFLE
jgi:hypothetical protein